MDRRTFLAAAGVAGAGALAGCAGVLGGQGGTDGSNVPTSPGPRQGDSLPADQSPNDGYPPDFDEQPKAADVSQATFSPYNVGGGSIMNASETVTVTLAPIEVAYNWYARGEARFVDARPRTFYERSHIYGAVSSPYNTAIDGTPIAEWDTGDRVVCYCTCPHHQSSIRAAELQQYGFEEVYVIDEGFAPWLQDFNYPVAGQQVSSLPAPTYIEGRTDASDAGKTAWAYRVGTDYTEATKIERDGAYRLQLRIDDPSAEIRVETPSYTVTGALDALSSTTVTADY
ncbi:MAG: rhodanese-like domain-containing protein [Halobacteriaceae archaeon]